LQVYGVATPPDEEDIELGLITKEVEVKISYRNIKHYESLDYKIPKIKNKNNKLIISKETIIKVKVKDLPDSTKIKVDCECDNCDKKIKNITWYNYKKYVKDDGKYYCNKCAKKLYATENSNKTKLKNGKSFEQWCIENNRQDVLDRWDCELNNREPNEIAYSTSKKYYFKCPRGLHKSELKSINDFTNNHEGSMFCNICNSFAQWGIDNLGNDFLEKYWDYEKNNELGIDPWKISKGIYNPNVYIICQEKDYHESYPTRCRDFTLGNRCPYCSTFHGKVHPLDSLGKLLENNNQLNLWSDKNKKSPYYYTPQSIQEVYWKCSEEKHKDYKRRICYSNKSEFRCPECMQERTESIIQEKVRLYLESLNIYTILHEYNCTIISQNPKIKNKNGRMPYDNEIKELKLIIEVHGKQHYEITGFHYLSAKHNNTTPEQELHYQKVKDRYNVCLPNQKLIIIII